MDKRTRTEEKCRKTTSKSGIFSPKLSKGIAKRIVRYCEITNQNKTKFVEQCVREKLDVLEKEMLSNMTKEELISLILKQEAANA